MSHRRIYQTDQGVIIRETGSSRTLAILPNEPLFEAREPSEILAKQIKHLPQMMDYLRHRAFHDDQDAKGLLDSLK